MNAPHKVPMLKKAIQIPLNQTFLEGTFHGPEGATCVVLFAHGSGSSRHSPRNRFVAESLQNAGLATLLLDLLTPAEEAVDVRTTEYRFDVGFRHGLQGHASEYLLQVSDSRLLGRARGVTVENHVCLLKEGGFPERDQVRPEAVLATSLGL